MSDLDAQERHRTVLLDEAVQMLSPAAGGNFIDATLGLGGHTEALLDASDASRVTGIDQDREAIELARKRLSRFGTRATLVQGNFSEVRKIAAMAGVEHPDGILADLGVSSLQLDSETRGFSFRFDAALDMRMNGRAGMTAAELLEDIGQDDLADLIFRYGEERHSRRIARRIIERRESGNPVKTTLELAELVRRAVPKSKVDKIHPATRTFQALRIAVNNELDILDGFISDSIDILKTEGVLAIITFHSLEDRIVKHAFQRLAGKCSCPPRIPQCVCGAVKRVEILTRKPVLPAASERDENPRSRSAKLRACRKIK